MVNTRPRLRGPNAGPRRRGRNAPAGVWGAAGGILVDRLVGEPPATLHPVVGFGAVMRRLEDVVWQDARAPGAVYAGIGIAAGAGAGAALGSALAATTIAVGGRALIRAAGSVSTALAAGDVEEARALLPGLVGRDTEGLDDKAMARAVVESVAENTVDAVVAPALWAAVAGAPGAMAYRAANTLDAMVGHRSDRYERFGWASARIDDVAGWLPARITAALVVTVRPRSATAVWRAVRRDAPHHPSPNAGLAEAAFAAALGLRLGGPSSYGGRMELRPSLGDGRPPEADDIVRAVHLSTDVSLALSAVLATAGLVAGHFARRRRR